MRWPTPGLPPRSVLPERPGSRAGQSPVRVRSLTELSSVDSTAWNQLNPSGSPFLTHAFLATLETRGLVGPGSGWRPCHALAEHEGKLLAAIPLYEKYDSYGEFVFDWAWAEVYQRTGKAYFPKLVAATPFTPVPGARLLAANAANRTAALPALLRHLEDSLTGGRFSSVHFLFPDRSEIEPLHEAGFLKRLDCRFLWRNAGYSDFDDFLGIFSARQRKNIRRERRKVQEAGVSFRWRSGNNLTASEWSQIHGLCASTFLRRGQLPYLDQGFFECIAKTMTESLLLNLAYRNDQIVAAAIFFRDSEKLYGRYWGSAVAIDCLHFESCYYQGIDYAIEHKLQAFDPGTQGEHKLRRGFAPVNSWSLHRFADERMTQAVQGWLLQEQKLVHEYIDSCRRSMPFSSPAQLTADPA